MRQKLLKIIFLSYRNNKLPKIILSFGIKNAACEAEKKPFR